MILAHAEAARNTKSVMARKDPKNKYKQIANFVYETGIHSKTPRSGFWFLGSGNQSVAEHLFHTAMITYALASITKGADVKKAVLMALMHDIGEGRTSDHNYVHQRYGRLSEVNAVSDIADSVPFGAEIKDLFEEEQARLTVEAKVVKDADQLEWISTLRGEEIKGNSKAKGWIKSALKRLKTKEAKDLAKILVTTHPDDWWYDNKDKWFINREQKFKKWKK
jgi:putative hydrolase of HD superfamily